MYIKYDSVTCADAEALHLFNNTPIYSEVVFRVRSKGRHFCIHLVDAQNIFCFNFRWVSEHVVEQHKNNCSILWKREADFK